MPDPTDPRFPDRPTHPDWERLSLAVQTQDMDSDQPDFDFAAYTNSLIDVKSMQYLAEQRAGHGLENILGIRMEELPVPMKAFIVSTFMDGLVAGVLFQKAGGHR